MKAKYFSRKTYIIFIIKQQITDVEKRASLYNRQNWCLMMELANSIYALE